MAGTSAGAAKRKRCTKGCGGFEHGDRPCSNPGPKPRLTVEEKRERNAAHSRQWRAANPERRREQARADRQRVKARTLLAYSPDGADEPTCCCCGVQGLVFLTLDHVAEDGAAKRVAAGSKGGISYYRALVRDGFPPGYETLCWNCNSAKHILGTCPHRSS